MASSLLLLITLCTISLQVAATEEGDNTVKNHTRPFQHTEPDAALAEAKRSRHQLCVVFVSKIIKLFENLCLTNVTGPTYVQRWQSYLSARFHDGNETCAIIAAAINDELKTLKMDRRRFIDVTERMKKTYPRLARSIFLTHGQDERPGNGFAANPEPDDESVEGIFLKINGLMVQRVDVDEFPYFR